RRPGPGAPYQPQAQPPCPLPPRNRGAERGARPGHPPPRDEGTPPRRKRQPARRHLEARRQPLQPQALSVLRRRFAPQPRVDVLGVHRLLQPRQLPPQVAWPPEAPVEQRRLEPAVEVLDTAVELWLPLRDEHPPDGEAQAEANPPRQGARRRPQPHSSRALSNWTCSGRPRSFQHAPRNQRTSSILREYARRRQTAPSKASLPIQM